MAILQYREALTLALDQEMEKNSKVFLMGEEVAQYDGAYKVTQGLSQKYGEKRVIDTPISELGFSGIGVGAAMKGLRPVIEFMTFNFATLAIDQIINHAAKAKYMLGGQLSCPIVFRGPNGSAGQLGATHSVPYDALYANFPGLKIIYPSEPDDAKALLKSAIQDNDPVIFFESEQMYGLKGEVNEADDYYLPIGKGKIKREGKDVTVVAHGKMYHLAKEAANVLSKEGIDCEIIDPLTLKPLDVPLIIESVKKTNRCVIVDESHPYGGIAAEIGFILQREAFDYLDAPILRVCLPDINAPFSKPLFDAWYPDVKDVITAIKKVLYKN
jgi:pyruvate dehydrogenase E1 component beta subunit